MGYYSKQLDQCTKNLFEVAVASAKRWDRKSSEALIDSAAPCHDAQVVGPFPLSNPLWRIVLTAKSQRIMPLHHNTFNNKCININFNTNTNINNNKCILAIWDLTLAKIVSAVLQTLRGLWAGSKNRRVCSPR